MACLIGKFVDFPKKITKLRMNWRNIKGEVQFYDQKSGWFEIYKNPEALIVILKANNFGTFLKMDPIHINRKWVKFVRLCINTNIKLATGQKLIIPDENMVEHKFNVWFDDFSVGCGNCGEIKHVFNECPDKTHIPP
ncbi:hypothetical protein V2J09_010734 [Rumex salicifolius]